MPVRLKAAFQTLEHTRALKEGSVRLPGEVWEFVEFPAIIQAFRRMVRGLEFDVSEMALTTYLCARNYHKPFTALPIFVVRGFHHGAIVYNTRLGVRSPKDLEGRKVGVNRGYTVTTGVWVRGILQHECGVDLSRVTWVLSGDEHVEEFRPPVNVMRLDPGKTLEEAVAAGELAAAIGVRVTHPDVAPFFPDAEKVSLRRLAHGRFYPINHLLVVKNELLESQPTLAVGLFEAFAAAKRPYLRRLQSGELPNSTKADRMYRSVFEITGQDPLPYGIAPNRVMLEELIGYAREQHILSRPFAVEELFAAGTTELVG